VTSFCPLGDLDTRGFPRTASRPSILNLLGGPFYSGERCRGIQPIIRSFNRSPGHYPGVRHTNLNVAELPAAGRGLFARGSGELTTGPWAAPPFACAGRGADTSPDHDPGAERLVAGSMEPPESDESYSLALRLLAVVRGAFWETEVSPPAGPGWRPLGWPVRRSSDHLDLAAASASLIFFPATMSRFSCRKTAGDSWPRWAFRKGSSSLLHN
jgi:hypothetical protein